MKLFLKRIFLGILVCAFFPTMVFSADLINYLNKDDGYFKKSLTPEVYEICREKGTEKAFSGPYDHFYEDGTYYCACCGGDFPLYSSANKFDSKTGWPSFNAPISPSNIKEQPDTRLTSKIWGANTEVVCARCGSHLGHVFNDGPEPTHKRYCMNSRALHFMPKGQTPERLFPE